MIGLALALDLGSGGIAAIIETFRLLLEGDAAPGSILLEGDFSGYLQLEGTL